MVFASENQIFIMKVLGLCSFPVESASTRYRLMQFVAPLSDKGINLEVSPFFDTAAYATLYKPGHNFRNAAQTLTSAGKRLLDFFRGEKFDALLIQREAMIIGPPFFEWLYGAVGKRPLILDLDDATYLSYVSPTYGRLGSALKCFGKTDKLIGWSEAVICGNRHIADYVESKGKKAAVVPTVVDTDKFRPVKKEAQKTPVIGWIGTHSTFPLLEKFFPVLQKLALKYDFTLKIVGAGSDKIEVSGLRIENSAWRLEREVEDFQSLDIGLYPLETTDSISEEWLAGKSGFKAIQYMTVGIPFVVTPVGICAEMGIEGETHFSAKTADQWYESLAKLLESVERREEMGANGRKYALEHYTVARQTDIIAAAIQRAVSDFRRV